MDKFFDIGFANSIRLLVAKTYDVDEVYSQQDILNYVVKNFSPSDIFSARDLREWADDND